MKRLGKALALLLALLLLLIGGLLAYAWAPDIPVDQLKARWAAPPSQFVEVEGLQVHLRDEGPRDDPQPLLLLHGTSASLHTWDGWVEALKPAHRVIRIDLPGFGLTGPFADNDYGTAHYNRFLAALLDRLGVARVAVAGNSLGGLLAWQFALAEPQRVGRLILVDAAGYPRNATSIPLGFRLANQPWLQPLMRNVLPRELIAASVRNVYGDPDKVSPELIERYYQLSLREGNREALRQRFKQGWNFDDHARIGQLRQPTLIIWGGRDRLIPPDNAARFKRDIAGSRLALFDDLGHVPQEEDPARSVAPVLRFLAGE
ncbi:2-hydroxy-6-oxononadienedioate/2-hydroxy-6-oxononatrienedioate hydrolase [compost metagenome]